MIVFTRNTVDIKKSVIANKQIIWYNTNRGANLSNIYFNTPGKYILFRVQSLVKTFALLMPRHALYWSNEIFML